MGHPIVEPALDPLRADGAGAPLRCLVVEIRESEVLIIRTSNPGKGVIDERQSYAIADHPTFTDVLLHFARTTGCDLQGCVCAIVLSGATVGSATTVARGRWTISRQGIAAMTQAPVILLNDVAASAWALLAVSPPIVHMLQAHRNPELAQAGRWAVVKIDDGVGLSAISRDAQGFVQVIDCEGGHAGFAAADALEDNLTAALRRKHGRVTWERILTLPDDDPSWAAAGFAPSRDVRQGWRAAVIGAFVGDVVLSLGAWNGVFIVGKRGLELRSTALLEQFNTRFEDKKPFHRLVASTPRWLLPDPDLGLRGGMAMLAHLANPSCAAEVQNAVG